MEEQKNGLSIKEDGFSNFISSDGFGKLNDELKVKAIVEFSNQANKHNESNTGWIGKILGIKTENIGLYISFAILVLLIAVGTIYIFIDPTYKINTNAEFWQLILPVITATLGYIFGKETKD